jgi:hypothetical protein
MSSATTAYRTPGRAPTTDDVACLVAPIQAGVVRGLHLHPERRPAALRAPAVVTSTVTSYASPAVRGPVHQGVLLTGRWQSIRTAAAA